MEHRAYSKRAASCGFFDSAGFGEGSEFHVGRHRQYDQHLGLWYGHQLVQSANRRAAGFFNQSAIFGATGSATVTIGAGPMLPELVDLHQQRAVLHHQRQRS